MLVAKRPRAVELIMVAGRIMWGVLTMVMWLWFVAERWVLLRLVMEWVWFLLVSEWVWFLLVSERVWFRLRVMVVVMGFLSPDQEHLEADNTIIGDIILRENVANWFITSIVDYSWFAVVIRDVDNLDVVLCQIGKFIRKDPFQFGEEEVDQETNFLGEVNCDVDHKGLLGETNCSQVHTHQVSIRVD